MMSKCTPQDIKNLMVQLTKDGKSIAEISWITHKVKPWSTSKDILKKCWDTGSTKNNWKNNINRGS